MESGAATRTMILTGGNAGIGWECARAVAALPDWHVVLACRDPARGAEAARAIAAATGNGAVEAMPLDLASLASVRAFGGALTARSDLPPLAALVCNAGVQVVGGTRYTDDGIELSFGVNHLGHFLLANLLLLLDAPPARIVFVSSGTHDPKRRTGMPAPRFVDPDALAHPERDTARGPDAPATPGRQRYTTSKLCNVLCAYELDRRLRAGPGCPTTVNVFDPGAVPGTGLARDAAPLVRLVWDGAVRALVPVLHRAGLPFHTPRAAGRALARLVTDPTLDGVTGRYFELDREASSSEESYDRNKAAALWEASARLVGLAHA